MPLYGIGEVADFKDLQVGRSYTIERDGKKYIIVRDENKLTECTVTADGVARTDALPQRGHMDQRAIGQ